MIRSKIRTRDRMSRSFAVIKPMGGGQIAGTRQNESIGSNEYCRCQRSVTEQEEEEMMTMNNNTMISFCTNNLTRF